MIAHFGNSHRSLDLSGYYDHHLCLSLQQDWERNSERREREHLKALWESVRGKLSQWSINRHNSDGSTSHSVSNASLTDSSHYLLMHIHVCFWFSPSPLLHLFICNALVSPALMIASLSSSAVTLSADLPQSFMWCLFLLLSFISSSSNLFFFKCCGSFAVDLFHPISHSLVCLPAHRRLSFHKTLSSSPVFLYFHSFYFKIWI